MNSNCMFYIIILLMVLLLIILHININKKYNCNNIIPYKISENTIWSYWEQGVDEIYPFYKLCIKTWIKKNPFHNIIIIDKYNIYNYLTREELPPNWEKIKVIQLKSDFVRLALLVKYGGIWMDISTICIKPINTVFKQEKSIEGFALRRYDNNNELSVFESWFITGKKDSKIIKKWRNELLKAFGNSKSVEEMYKKYFDDVDLQKIEYGWYLTIVRVLMKQIQFEEEIKYLYYNDSNIYGAEETAFLHYDKNSNINFLEENDDFINIVEKSGTPILKFTGSGGELKKLKETDFYNKNTVIFKLLNY
jgi:hypothetical protein